MRLTNLTVDGVGILEDVHLRDIPALSVVYGGNGSGKSTLARFFHDALFSSTSRTIDRESRFVGQVDLTVADNHWQLRRYRNAIGQDTTEYRTTDQIHTSESLRQHLPTWVTNQVVDEILCPGYEDADRFALLTRLCLETGGRAGSSNEIRQTEAAVAQAVQERRGTAADPGIEQQIADLEQDRDQLENELEALRRHAPSLPREVEAAEARIATLRARQRQISTECEALRQEILMVPRKTAEFQHPNTLPLNRDALQSTLHELEQRLQEWQQILQSIDRMTPNGRLQTVDPIRSSDSIRAVISRLEERILQCEQPDIGTWRQSIEQETAALCHFASQHEESVTTWQRQQESGFGFHAAECVRQAAAVLQAQIAAVREELDRADNILDEPLNRRHPDNGSQWNRNDEFGSSSSGESPQGLEAEQGSLQNRLTKLLTEEGTNSSEVQRLIEHLDELRRRQRALPSLEEIDEVKARIAEADARMALLNSHRDVLLATEQTLRQVVTRLKEQNSASALEIAGPWLRQLTDGECQRLLTNDAGTDVLIETTTSPVPLRISHLSRGTQHQLALVLRLALLEAHAPKSGRLPLIIDDVFITSDDARGAAAADLIREVVSRGQQVMMLTCQNDVRGLLTVRGAHVYSLTADTPDSQPVEVPETSLVFKAFNGAAEEFPGELEDTIVNDDDDSHWLFYVEPEHPVSELSGLAVSELNALRAAGIETIDGLLLCLIPEAHDRIQSAGFFITDERLQALQMQAEMTVSVPMLRQRDAELLIASGIGSARQLSKLRPEATHELVSRFQQSDSGLRFLRNGMTIDEQQAISWNRWALHARSLERARTSAAARRERGERSRGILSSAQRIRARVSSQRDRTRRGGQTQRKMARPSVSSDSRRRRAERSERRLRSRHDAEHTRGETQTPSLKFYLQRSSNVEAAPSISPRTAERLARVGVQTVDDLLTCDADTVSTLLDNQRITPSVVEQWKSQATLVCTIPRLRGHDAQILVACGKNEPLEIHEMSPEQLYALVQPFCDTTEGARIIRGGRKPDLQEVTNWIAWAGQSRELQAA